MGFLASGRFRMTRKKEERREEKKGPYVSILAIKQDLSGSVFKNA